MPAKVAKDSALVAKNTLKALLGSFEWVEHIEASPERKQTTGFGVDLFAKYSNCVLGANSLGLAGSKPERIGEKAAKALFDEISFLAPLDSHCIDQLIPFMALANGKSIIEGKLTKHAITNIMVTEKLLGAEFKVDTKEQRARISVEGIAFTI